MTAAPAPGRPPGMRLTAEERDEIEGRTVALLLAGATLEEIRNQVGITAPTIVRIRREAGIPDPGKGQRKPAPRTIDDALAANVEDHDAGHARWTGPMAGRMPQLFAEGDRFNARHVIFERQHGRPPVGYVRAHCGDQACAAGAHLADDVMRRSSEEEPVTVQALTDLLDEIDREGGPQAARDNRLHLSSERPAMTTAPVPSPPAVTPPLAAVPQPAGRTPSETLPLGQLLKWADTHDDEDVRDQAARAHATLTALRRRYDTDTELTAITSETAELEQRLAELRARQNQLAPPKAKARRKTSADHDAATVRAWATEAGVECPAHGRVPKSVVEAWRTATSAAAP